MHAQTTEDVWLRSIESALPTTPQPASPNYLYAIDPAKALHTSPIQDLQQNIVEASVSVKNFLKRRSAGEEIAQATPPTLEPTLVEPSEAPAGNEEQGLVAVSPENQPKTILINFNNVSIIEYIRFISRITNRNFIFDENDLQFNVTIISEEPTSLENTMTALLQVLRIHDLILIEEGNNFLIHRNPKVNSISKVVSDDMTSTSIKDAEIITKVFRLNTMDPEKAAAVIRPLVSEISIIEVIKESNHVIVTDLAANIVKISQLLKSLDAPNSGLVIGQYVVKISSPDTLIPLAERIMQPIAQEQPLIFVPQPGNNSIFIVSTPYLVERTISIIQYLDQQQAETRILNLQELKIEQPPQEERLRTPSGDWEQDTDGRWKFRPSRALPTEALPDGEWMLDENGNWQFMPGGRGRGLGPQGKWVLDSNGNWIFGLDQSEGGPGRLTRQFRGGAELPGGAQKQMKFYIHKLLYRKGDEIEMALRSIADGLRTDQNAHEDLITALGSVQWIEPTNSLIITGVPQALRQVKELIEDIDIPLREVFIEMLILDATVDDALNYGVTYGTRFGGGHTSGAQGTVFGATPLIGALTTTAVLGLGQAAISGIPNRFIPDGTTIANGDGFSLGVIGQKITHCGKEFGSLGALVRALHDRNCTDIIMNPKIITEDNAPAEIFIGINTAFKTQAVSNDRGSVITNNFEFRDVGTRLKVTPYISNDDMVTLDIAQEISSVVSGLQTGGGSNNINTENIGPTTRKNTLTTRVHVPDGYFLVLGGLMQDEVTRNRSQVPCLGGVPVIGGFFTDKRNTDGKRNTMIFMRPIIVDSEEEIDHLTKHQQDIWRTKKNLRNSLDYEVEEALDWFNVKKTLYNENECDYDDLCR